MAITHTVIKKFKGGDIERNRKYQAVGYTLSVVFFVDAVKIFGTL